MSWLVRAAPIGGAVWLWFGGLGIRSARAEGAGIVAHYDAPIECPSREWLEEEVARRSNEREGHEGRLRVEITTSGGVFVGRVRRADAEASESREVTNGSCEQLGRALALIGSLLLAPRGAESRDVDGDPSDTSASANDTEKARAARANQAQAPRPARRARANRAARVPSEARQAPGSDPAEEMRGDGTAHIGTSESKLTHGPRVGLTWDSLVSADFRPGPRVGYRVTLGSGAWDAWAGVPMESEIGLSVARTESGSLRSEIGTAELTAALARVQLCHGLLPERRLSLGLCAGLEGGQLSGRGAVNQSSTVTRSAWWFRTGLQARVEWRPVGSLFVDGGVGGLTPLVRPKFFFTERGSPDRRRTIFEPKNSGISAELGLGLHFP